MHDYAITLTVFVKAHDREEADEIANTLAKTADQGQYKTETEVDHVEEL